MIDFFFLFQVIHVRCRMVGVIISVCLYGLMDNPVRSVPVVQDMFYSMDLSAEVSVLAVIFFRACFC